MDWIKRNLYFFIGSIVAVLLMGAAGYYLYSKWQLNNEIMAKLDADYAELNRLNQEKPHPGAGKVDNVRIAKEQQQQLRAFIQKCGKFFQPIAPIPEHQVTAAAGPNAPAAPKVNSQDFAAALRRTIDQLQKRATNSSIGLPADFAFSFTAQKPKMNFAPGSLEPLSVQLGEIKTICDVLFEAKINSLDNIRRERVSSDDSASGATTDYFSEKSITNDLAVLTPYEVTFRCFSTELAAVLAGFGSSPHGLMVKALNVELGSTQSATTDQPGMITPVYSPAEQPSQDAFMQRYGLRGRGGRPMAPPPPVAAPPPTAVANRGGLQTVLDEKQLKVTMAITIIKLLPPKS